MVFTLQAPLQVRHTHESELTISFHYNLARLTPTYSANTKNDNATMIPR